MNFSASKFKQFLGREQHRQSCHYATSSVSLRSSHNNGLATLPTTSKTARVGVAYRCRSPVARRRRLKPSEFPKVWRILHHSFFSSNSRAERPRLPTHHPKGWGRILGRILSCFFLICGTFCAEVVSSYQKIISLSQIN